MIPIGPSSSWPMTKARFLALLGSSQTRVCIAFWFFGLINNVLYVIILSAALDLVGPSVPKAVVLLADVLPSFFTKLLAPYIIHLIPYPVRILAFCSISTAGMLLIALTPAYTDGGTISAKMAGIILASFSSGAGELSFLSLTHFYGEWSLAAWGSGTGAAGLLGAGAYALATTAMGMAVRSALLVSAFLPVVMLVGFFVVLPRGPLSALPSSLLEEEESLVEEEERLVERDGVRQDDGEDNEQEGLLYSRRTTSKTQEQPWNKLLKTNLRRASKLFFPYMLPLLLVYIAEYTINQGVSPTLLFPLPSTPFTHYRAFYPTYNAIYQAGVFLSRSSTPFFRIHNLYLPSFLQIANLALLIAQSVFDFIPSVYVVFAVVFWEGLLGGLVYVNTFAEILDKVDVMDREFSLGATSVSDSGGICLAGLLSLGLETALCGWQVERGRDWCRQL